MNVPQLFDPHYIPYALILVSFIFNNRYTRHTFALMGAGMLWLAPKMGITTSHYELHFALGLFAVNSLFIVLELWMQWHPLPEAELHIYNQFFKKMSRANFKKLLSVSAIDNKANGSTITIQGKRTEKVLMIVDGSASVLVDGDKVAELRNGDFIGDLSFISGNVASATVRSDVLTTYLIWDQNILRELLRKNPQLLVDFNMLLEKQITKKLIYKENAVA